MDRLIYLPMVDEAFQDLVTAILPELAVLSGNDTVLRYAPACSGQLGEDVEAVAFWSRDQQRLFTYGEFGDLRQKGFRRNVRDYKAMDQSALVLWYKNPQREEERAINREIGRSANPIDPSDALRVAQGPQVGLFQPYLVRVHDFLRGPYMISPEHVEIVVQIGVGVPGRGNDLGYYRDDRGHYMLVYLPSNYRITHLEYDVTDEHQAQQWLIKVARLYDGDRNREENFLDLIAQAYEEATGREAPFRFPVD